MGELRALFRYVASLLGYRVGGGLAGRWFSCLSLAPIREAIEFLLEGHVYMQRMKAASGGAPVFKIHPGIRAIALTDHVSASFYFSAPTSVLNREDVRRFASLSAPPRILGASYPALVSGQGVGHDAARAFTMAILHARADTMESTLLRVMHEEFKALHVATTDRTPTGEHLDIIRVVLRWTTRAIFEWVFDTAAPSTEDTAWYSKRVFSNLQSDSVVSRAAWACFFSPAWTLEEEARLARMTRAVRASPRWSEYQSMALVRHVSFADLDKMLLHTFMLVGFATFAHIHPSLARLAVNPDVLSELRHELKGGKVLETSDLAPLPLFDSACHELLRLCPAPPFVCKRAQTGFDLPAGDGQLYRINKGELLLVSTPCVSHDPSVFAAPHEFRPRRFLASPDLKLKLFTFGTPAGGTTAHPYGCGGAEGDVALNAFKLFVGNFIHSYHFELGQRPLFHRPRYFGSVGPVDLRFNLVIPLWGATSSQLYRMAPPESSDPLEDLYCPDTAYAFSAASTLTKSLRVTFPKPIYLVLYGLYKQARNGDAPAVAPPMAHRAAYLKWNAWRGLRGHSRERAMTKYVGVVRRATTPPPSGAPHVAHVARATRLHAKFVSVSGVYEDEQATPYTVTVCAQPGVEHAEEARIKIEFLDSASDKTAVFMLHSPEFMRSGGEVTGEVTLPHIHEVVAVYVTLHAGPSRTPQPWRLNTMRVEWVGLDGQIHVRTFSHHSMVSSRMVLFSGEGVLPQHTCDKLLPHRRQSLEQERVVWAFGEWLPGLPRPARFRALEDVPDGPKFRDNGQGGLMAVRTAHSVELDDALPSFQAFRSLFDPARVPHVANHLNFESDGEFVAALVAGTHPTHLRRVQFEDSACRELLTELGDAHLYAHVLDRGDTLEAAIHRGAFFVADYSLMRGVHGAPGRLTTAPVCVLYSSYTRRELLPVVILVNQGGPLEFAVHPQCTPPSAWHLGKMSVLCADLNYFQVTSHFLFTHHIMEVFTVSLHRQLSSAHPVHRLLRPRLDNVAAIGVLARKFIVGEGGIVDKLMSVGGSDGAHRLMQRAWAQRSLWQALHFPTDLRARGVDDPQTLPDYPYRDDGRLLWGVLHRYVSTSLSSVYPCDSSVVEDEELQSWVAEVRDECDRNRDCAVDLPQADAVSVLVELVTGLMFTGSATHACMNYNQYEKASFPPFAPSMLLAPHDAEGLRATDVTPSLLLEMLPRRSVAREMVKFTAVLSKRFPDDVTLGNCPSLLDSSAHREATRALRDNLAVVERAVIRANAQRGLKYDLLTPSLIPAGIDL